VLDKLNPQLSSLSSEPFPDAGKNLFCRSFEEKVKKRNETVKILRRSPGSQTCSFFVEEPPPNPGQGEGVNFLDDGQITNQASQPEGGAHISEVGAGAGGSSRLLNQVRTQFHPKVSSNSGKPVKYKLFLGNLVLSTGLIM